MSDRMLEGLNDAQREAVTHSGGPLLILAGAGTGKTRVITRRIAWLAANGVPPEHVLALTFSAKAAAEMRSRTEELLEDPFEELVCTTFHSFCVRLLQEEALEAGFDPFFHPATPADRLALLMERLDSLDVRHHDMRGNPAPFLAKVIERIDRLKDEMVSSDEYAAWAESLASSEDEAERDCSPRESEFARLYAAHDRLLDEMGAMDFGEMIVRVIRLLQERPAVQRRVSERYRAVLVDEYQDTNYAQQQLLRLLVADHRNVVVVGDDDQSIYRFRGASRKNILEFQETFPDAQVIALETNYRSSQAILEAAHAVVEPNEQRLPKKLKASRSRKAVDLDPVAFWRCENERAQAQAVAGEIERLIADGIDAAETAVLVRSVRNEGQLMATALEERGIPYRLVGGAGFFERSEVRDLLAWLRLLADPQDSRAVVRALMRPPVELGPVDLARCTTIARRRKSDMISALGAALGSPDVPPEARERIGLRKQHLFNTSSESLERLVNIAKFADLAAGWVRRRPGRTSRDFAEYVSAVSAAGLREDEAVVHGHPSAVHVMTMHGAKGLEYDCVYVLGVQQSRMPGRRRSGELVPDALLKEDLPGTSTEAHVAEMRRLLYVAMTRARKRLVLSWPRMAGAGDQTEQKPSSFYEEARAAIGGTEEERQEELLGIHEDLYAAFRMLRDEVMGGVQHTGARMGEMRLDAHLDVSAAVGRYMEMLKLAALIERHPRPEELPAAIAEINSLLTQTASAEQRQVYEDSNLDELLLETERENLRRRRIVGEHADISLEAYLPIRGGGLMLSATDIEVYRTCPLRYKFARVYNIPKEQTLQQRFGILVHQVLERYHSQLANEETLAGVEAIREPTPDKLMTLFETGWRRLGFSDSNEERQLHEKAVVALEL
jgi:DNA helicase-2/ATP-dependent DNA helicase PcrA